MTTSRPTSSFSSGTTLPRSPRRVRCSDRCWRPSSGMLPGALWIIIGCVMAGAVHDMVVLFASVRHKGQSLAKIAESEIGKTAGMVASFAFLFILILTLAGLSIAVVNAMFESAWGTFTVFATMPIAFLMGIYMYKIRPGDVKGASIMGVSPSCSWRSWSDLMSRRIRPGHRSSRCRKNRYPLLSPSTDSLPRSFPSGCCSVPGTISPRG